VAEVRFSARALRSLRGIERYLGERNPAAAERVIEEIGRACALIGDYPEMGLSFMTHVPVPPRCLPSMKLYGSLRLSMRRDQCGLVPALQRQRLSPSQIHSPLSR
jgi:plasmid stabilization system protein ParE